MAYGLRRYELRKLKEHNIHFAIFCSSHNPTGRVWEREEIEKAMEIYKANECVVISDEIWSDLTLPGFKHIPTQSVSKDARERTIALYAPSKTFNLAGLERPAHHLQPHGARPCGEGFVPFSLQFSERTLCSCADRRLPAGGIPVGG